MAVFNQAEFDNHEQVVFCSDEASGLKAIIAVHNTAIGPALGGCRMWSYENEEAAKPCNALGYFELSEIISRILSATTLGLCLKREQCPNPFNKWKCPSAAASDTILPLAGGVCIS